MEYLINFKYQGLSQLLAEPLQKIQKKTSLDITSQKNNSDSNLSKNQKLGFIPFRYDDSTKKSYNPQSQEFTSIQLQHDDDVASQSSSNLPQMNSKNQIQVQTRSRKGPYKKYTTEQKRQAIELINNGKDIKTVSKEFNIPRRNLLRWRKNGCERKQGGGRPSDFLMEQKLFDMILNKQVTTEKQIRQYALSATNFKKFKASKGWYVKFWRRFHEYKNRLNKAQNESKIQI